MLLNWFIKNEWRETKRSAMFEQSLGIKIFLGFLFFIIFAEMLIGSIFLGDKFNEIFPDDDPVEKFNSFVLYGFAVGFVARVFLQKVPVLSIQPYLHLPVKKSILVNYVLGKSLFAFFNFIPVVIFTPFIIFQIAPWFSGVQLTGYILAIIFTVFSVNFLSILFKRSMSGVNWISGIILLIIVALALFDYFEIISIGSYSSLMFTTILEKPIWALLPFSIFVIAYLLNYRELTHHLYPEDNVRFKKAAKRNTGEIKYLKGLGEIGVLISLELKLILRNKRSKSTLVFLPIFLLYGLIFYPQEVYMNMTGMLIFVGIFMTGPITLIYGQYLLSWESSYFDGILTHIDDFDKYFRAKYYLMMFSTIAAFLLTLPYAYFGAKILLINFAAMLFNVGVSSIFILYMSSNNKKRLDLSQGAAFNYQGVSATQFLISFPIMLFPLLVFLPFWAFGYPMSGIIAIGVVGFTCFIFNKQLINFAVNRFLRRRYIIGEGFRKKN